MNGVRSFGLTIGFSCTILCPLWAQDPLDALRRAAELGDSVNARITYTALLASPESRRAYAGLGEAILGDVGMADDAISVLRTLPRTDPVARYTLAVASRRVRRLYAADEALRDAVLQDDVTHVPRTLWAWNAVQQFDPKSAIDRVGPLQGPEADAIRKSAHDMTSSAPWMMRLAALGTAALLLLGSILVLLRHRSSP